MLTSQGHQKLPDPGRVIAEIVCAGGRVRVGGCVGLVDECVHLAEPEFRFAQSDLRCGSLDELGDVVAVGDVDDGEQRAVGVGESLVHRADAALAPGGFALQLNLDGDEAVGDPDGEVWVVRLLHGATVVSVAQLQAPEVMFENLTLSGPVAPTQVQPR